MFTMALGRFVGIEILTFGKVGAVLTRYGRLEVCKCFATDVYLSVMASFSGVTLVSLADSSKQTLPKPPKVPSPNPPNSVLPPPSNPLLGDFLALLSALFYALYLILLKLRIRTESRIDMQLFFGFVGLFNILFLWPVGVVLHLTGLEKWGMPKGIEWVGIAVNVSH